MKRKGSREDYLKKLDNAVERSCQILLGNVDYRNTFDKKVYERVKKKRAWLSSIDFPQWVNTRSEHYYKESDDDMVGDVLLFYSIALTVVKYDERKERTIEAVMSSIIAKHIRKLDSYYRKSRKITLINVPFVVYTNNTIDTRRKLPIHILLDYARSYEDRRWYLLEYVKIVMGYTYIDYSEISHVPIGTIKEINRLYENIHKPKKSVGGNKRNPPGKDNKVWARPSSRGPAEGQTLPQVGFGHQLKHYGITVRLRRKYGC